ncbi:MAG TPA: hypothetical protein VF070_05655 [Streptosporangiaceae bacterium]
MEPLSITVATLIATYAAQAFGGQLGQAAASGLKNLVGLVRRKLTGNDHAQTVLAAAVESAQGPAGADALAEPLDAVLKNDEEFRSQLEELVNALRSDPEIGRFVTTVSGNAQVGKITNIGTVTGDVTFLA